ncbi:MAG: glycosyltransferase family 2 protein [Anaerolineales bacterium]|nr:glycosyltransferase family 2 protein [Anaerolineales bacterium]
MTIDYYFPKGLNEMGDHSIRITAALCTHNRAALLDGAIASLLAQSLPPPAYEILVIDNSSNDATPAVIQRYQDTPGPVTLRSAVEPMLGLSYARNRAAQLAAGEIIAYLDDDAVADTGWLAGLLAAYAAFPDAWAVGGPVQLLWRLARPSWLGDDLLPMLSQLDLGARNGGCSAHRSLSGAQIFPFTARLSATWACFAPTWAGVAPPWWAERIRNSSGASSPATIP